MADVQCEKGFSKIANQTLEAMAKTNISGREWRFITVIWRLTYGWKGKKEARIPLSVFSKATGVAPADAVRIVTNLERMGMIKKISSSKGSVFAFVKDFDKWVGNASVGKFKNLNQFNDEEITFKGSSGDSATSDLPSSENDSGDSAISNLAISANSQSASSANSENATRSCPKLLDSMPGSGGLKIFKDILKIKDLPKAEDSNRKSSENKNGFGLWIDANREMGRNDPPPVGSETKAAKNVFEALGKDAEKTKAVMIAFLKDNDPFIKSNGYSISLLPKRIAKYLNGDGDQDDGYYLTNEQIAETIAYEEKLRNEILGPAEYDRLYPVKPKAVPQ